MSAIVQVETWTRDTLAEAQAIGSEALAMGALRVRLYSRVCSHMCHAHGAAVQVPNEAVPGGLATVWTHDPHRLFCVQAWTVSTDAAAALMGVCKAARLDLDLAELSRLAVALDGAEFRFGWDE